MKHFVPPRELGRKVKSGAIHYSKMKGKMCICCRSAFGIIQWSDPKVVAAAAAAAAAAVVVVVETVIVDVVVVIAALLVVVVDLVISSDSSSSSSSNIRFLTLLCYTRLVHPVCRLRIE